MSIKTVLIFIIGLAIWLIATNFQTISTSIASMLNPPEHSQQEIALNTSEDLDKESNHSEPSSHAVDSEDLETEEIATEANTEVADLEETLEVEEQATESNETTTPTAKNQDINNSAEDTSKPEKLEKQDKAETVTNDTGQSHENQFKPYTFNSASSGFNINPFSNYQNSSMWMNPMMGMMMPMMSMMGTMMNPNMYMNPMIMMNYPVTTLTQKQNLEAMMKSMDPKLMFAMMGQPVPNYDYDSDEVPDQVPVARIPGFPTQLEDNWPKNTVSPEISREAKMNAFQTAMAMSPLSMRNMVSMMADKIPVDEGVSWDDAVEAMKLRANEVNFKFVGSSPLWKQIEAETEQPSAKVEMFRFCDARMARRILDEVPEFIVFLPCKIALLEDEEGQLWVMTLDWDVSWMDYAQNPNNNLSKELRADAKKIRDNIQYIMEGAATGDF